MNVRQLTVQLIILAACVLSAASVSAQQTGIDLTGATAIALNDDATTIDGDGAQFDGNSIVITSGGTYSLTGSLSDGQIRVDSADETVVTLVLSGVDIRSSTTAPIYIRNAEEVEIVLADGTRNYLSDAANYVYEVAGEDEPNAALFSDEDLVISGSGALTVDAHYNDAIASKDSLAIAGAAITVQSVDDGIRGKDSLILTGATLSVTAQGDGLKADNEEDAALGYIQIDGGVYTVAAGGDAIQAATNVVIAGGTFDLTTAGGSGAYIDETLSAKGIKGAVSVTIEGGDFMIDAADDAIHSNSAIVVNGGRLDIATGDDALHADTSLAVNGGTIDISESYEGLESAVITISGGDIHVVSSDDGLNVAGGADSSGFGGGGGRPQGRDRFATAGTYFIYIHGGYIVVNSRGDGIDANGSIEMTGGIVIVNGPTENMNGALDYDGSFTISGGMLIAVGSAGMAQAPDTSSTQNSLLVNLNAPVQAGTLVNIENSSSGDNILTFSPASAYQSIAFSSPELATGGAFTVSIGGTADGASTDGLYRDASFTPGTQVASVTVTSVVTQFGGRSRR